MVTIVDPPPSGTGVVCYTRIPFPIPSGLLQRPVVTAYAGEADLSPYDVTYAVTGSTDKGEPTCCSGVDSIVWPSSERIGALYPVEAGNYEFAATVDTGVDGRVKLTPALLTVVGAECLQVECDPCGLEADCPPCGDGQYRVVFISYAGPESPPTVLGQEYSFLRPRCDEDIVWLAVQDKVTGELIPRSYLQTWEWVWHQESEQEPSGFAWPVLGWPTPYWIDAHPGECDHDFADKYYAFPIWQEAYCWFPVYSGSELDDKVFYGHFRVTIDGETTTTEDSAHCTVDLRFN